MLFGLCGIWLVFIKVVFGWSHVSEEGDELVSSLNKGAGKGSERTIWKEGSYATPNVEWALSAARLREFVFGPLWLCIFGVFRLRVQQSGQGKSLSGCMWIFKGVDVDGSKGAIFCLSKLCLFLRLLREAQLAPSLQSLSRGPWPSSPWLWHSGTTPVKSGCNKYQLLLLLKQDVALFCGLV